MSWAEKFRDVVAIINIVILLGMMLILFGASLIVPYFVHPILYLVGVPLASVALWVIADIVETVWG